MSTTSSTHASRTGGVSFLGLLTLAFIVLKLTGVIAWSWWWVLAPLWISAALVAVTGAVALVVILLVERGHRA